MIVAMAVAQHAFETIGSFGQPLRRRSRQDQTVPSGKGMRSAPSAAAIEKVPERADNHQDDYDHRAYRERHCPSAVRRRGR